MSRIRNAALTVAAFAALVAGCSSKQASDTTIAPGPTVTMNAFAGTWTTGPAASAGIAPGTCGGIEYTITKISETSAGVTYSGTCAGVSITGTGKGTLAGSMLNWEASGTAAKGTLDCPFQFTNSTATPQGDGILVNYGGTVCGVPVQGSQLLRRR